MSNASLGKGSRTEDRGSQCIPGYGSHHPGDRFTGYR